MSEEENNDGAVNVGNVVRLAIYTFFIGAICAYVIPTASELGYFSKWPYLEKLFSNPNIGIAIGVLIGLLWAKHINRTIDEDTSGWAGEEYFRSYLYISLGAGIAFCGLILFAQLFDNINTYMNTGNTGWKMVIIVLIGMFIGGLWAMVINKNIRKKGPPLSDEEFERLVKDEEAKMDDK